MRFCEFLKDFMRFYEFLWDYVSFYEILLHNVQKDRNKNSPAPPIRTKKNWVKTKSQKIQERVNLQKLKRHKTTTLGPAINTQKEQTDKKCKNTKERNMQKKQQNKKLHFRASY